MNLGQILALISDINALLLSHGILRPDGTFDPAKLDTAEEDIQLAVDIEVILKRYGLQVPEKVEKILAILPLLAGIIK